ncbi:MAG TPA: IgGFc-binding protein, partial [Kofleriaceae bacterium]|nr:IgGFc-binding protein [Kofleriaceae bacterium]
MRVTVFFMFVVGLAACGPNGRNNGSNCAGLCTALGYQACHEDGRYEPPVSCGPDQRCDPNAGCVVCPPEGLYCGGATDNDVFRCNKQGTEGTLVESCAANEVCSDGECKTPCEAAMDNPSNVGCDFWAVDLDNEISSIAGITTDSAANQFALVVANNNPYPVTVTITKNGANIGQPLNEQAVASAVVSPGVAKRIDLPQREVDGCMAQNGPYMPRTGSGTFVSPHAYHVTTTGPVVVYQFNPIIQAYSNDASTLIPIQALGMDYVVLGYQTANPCGISGFNLPDIPDHTAVTIVPIEDNTTVTVTATHPIVASAGPSGIAIPATPKGTPLTLKLSRYMVANLESDQPKNVSATQCGSMVNGGGQNGDFTGTQIHSDKPIIVFTSGERGEGFGGAQNIEYPPDFDSMSGDDTCCTDHLEEQLFPVTALGKEFAIARSPIRSTDQSGWVEPDIMRVVATVDNTHITTNLPAPYNSITLNRNQQKTFGATTGFALKSDQPIEVGSFLVSQHFIKHGYIGDPSQITLPAAEQFRKDYVFLVPATFTDNYMVVAKPVDAAVVLDGTPLMGAEFSNCYAGSIGMVNGVMYDQLTCKLAEGQHTVSADKPFGLSVYGYYNVGSYAFVGGSDVKIINPIL